MPFQDLPANQLKTVTAEGTEPADFDEFWLRQLTSAREVGTPPVFEQRSTPFPDIGIWDVAFAGHQGDTIRGWLVAPRLAQHRRSAVVWFPGYGSGRGEPHEWVAWAAAGVSVLAVDVRGQGADRGGAGATADLQAGGLSASGFMTRGIEAPDDYYYTRVIVDCVRAIDAVRAFDGVDPACVVAGGASQGGGLALAVSGLVPDLFGVISDVPFLCDFPRATRTYEYGPYEELVRYLSVQRSNTTVFDTLAYVDAVNFARRANAPLLASVALMDGVCPPSTVFAAYNSYSGAKSIDVYEFNGHEGGAATRWPRHHDFVSGLGFDLTP